MSTIEVTIHIPGMTKSIAANKHSRPRRKNQEPAAAQAAAAQAAHRHPNVTWEAATAMSLRR